MFGTLLTITTQDKHLLLNGWPISDILSLISLVILFFTFFLSMRALTEATRSNSLSSLPVFKLKLSRGKSDDHDTVQIENIGNGTALDVRVDSYYQSFVDDIFFPEKANHYNLRFSPVDIIPKCESRSLDTSKSFVGGLIDVDSMAYGLFNSDKSLIFNIRYQDLSGTKYISKIRIEKNNVYIVGVPKKLAIIKKILYLLFRIREKITTKVYRYRADKKQEEANKKRRVN